MRLSNKVTLVTGSARGIGRSIGEHFHREGAIVIFSDILDDEGIQTAQQFSDRTEYMHLDVRNEPEWASVTTSISNKYGRIDVVVNNAGISGRSDSDAPQNPEEIPIELWHNVHAVNLDGVMLGCKYAIKAMKDAGGSIINISSRSGLVGVPGLAPYASSKAAVRNHSKTVALYCAEQNYKIRCNSIHPGLILTKLWDHIIGTGAERENGITAISRKIPLGHMGTPEDVAFAALYLASDESLYVTGIELNVDGGILAGTVATPPDNNSED